MPIVSGMQPSRSHFYKHHSRLVLSDAYLLIQIIGADYWDFIQPDRFLSDSRGNLDSISDLLLKTWAFPSGNSSLTLVAVANCL